MVSGRVSWRDRKRTEAVIGPAERIDCTQVDLRSYAKWLYIQACAAELILVTLSHGVGGPGGGERKKNLSRAGREAFFCMRGTVLTPYYYYIVLLEF